MSAWYDWLVGAVPNTIIEPVNNPFLKVKGHIMGLYKSANEKRKNELRSNQKKNLMRKI